MKKLLLFASMFLLMSTVGSAQISQETSTRMAKLTQAELSELILHIPDNSAKTTPDVIDILKNTSGVSFDSYCGSLHTFFLRYDPAMVDDDAIVASIKQNGYNFSVIEKKMGSIEQVKQHCYK